MGGGSSDAASTLIALNRLWKLKLTGSELETYWPHAGADVPFFLRGQNAWVEGIGETIRPLEKHEQPPSSQFVVVKPERDWRQSNFSSKLLKRDSDHATILGFAAAHYDFGRNDLQPVAESLCPEVKSHQLV